MTSRIGIYWRNAAEMPSLLGLLCRGGMFAGPILLIFLPLPVTEWTVNGQRMSYAELWRSGAGIGAVLFAGFITLGTWGMAARQRWSRWALVLAPVLPIVVFPKALVPEIEYALVNGLVTAAIIYGCLFHLKSVKAYLLGSGNDKQLS